MDINFQDRIDEYLLHPDRLSEEEKSQFLSELEADPKKRVQFELTRDVRLAVTSRARKMSRMEEMRTMYGHVRSHVAMNCLNVAEDRQDAPRRKRWVWLSGIAAAVVLGFFVTRLVLRLFFVRRWTAWRWSSLRRYAVRRSQLRPARRHVVG